MYPLHCTQTKDQIKMLNRCIQIRYIVLSSETQRLVQKRPHRFRNMVTQLLITQFLQHLCRGQLLLHAQRKPLEPLHKLILFLFPLINPIPLLILPYQLSNSALV